MVACVAAVLGLGGRERERRPFGAEGREKGAAWPKGEEKNQTGGGTVCVCVCAKRVDEKLRIFSRHNFFSLYKFNGKMNHVHTHTHTINRVT